MKKYVDNIVPEHLLRQAQERALELFSRTISKTYGPLGGITAFAKTSPDGKTMAIANYSKDGFNVHKNIEVDMPIESLLKDEIEDICRAVIKSVGDGTTTAIMMSYQIFKGMMALYEAGYRKRAVIKSFKKMVKEVSDAILANKRDVTLDDIYNIALTSLNGNAEMAENIKSIYSQYGMQVFIDVQGNNTKDTVIKGFDGMIYDNGYLDDCFINDPIRHVCNLDNPHVYVFDSPVDTPLMLTLVQLIIKTEIEDVNMKLNQMKANGTLDKLIASGKTPKLPEPLIIFAPYFSRDANSYLDKLINVYTSCPVTARNAMCIVQTGNADPNKLIDIAKMTGAKFIKKYIDPEAYKEDQKKGLAPNMTNITEFAGRAEKIIVDKLQTKIVNPAMMRDEKYEYTVFYQNYIESLKDQLSKLEETNAEVVQIGNLRRRIHILQGNMVDMYVGGIGISDKKSLTDAVEDAVLNCRSAAKEGVGFGASYEGLTASYQVAKKYEADESADKVDVEVARLIATSYFNTLFHLYYPYFEDNDATHNTIFDMMKDENRKGPLNIISEEYDKMVLTSIMTEPSILDAISRILTVLFDTNQFLLPTPQFNIYTLDDKVTVIRPDGVSEKIEEDNEVKESSDVSSKELFE